MQQTLLAVLAIMVAAQVSLNQYETISHARVQMINNEVETLATSAALDMLSEIGTKPFDEATVSETVDDEDDLEPLPFSSGGTWAGASDIDDYHEIQTYTYTSDLDEISYTVDIVVQYVDDEDVSQVANSQTFAKEVILTLQNEYMTNPVSISQVFTYP